MNVFTTLLFYLLFGAAVAVADLLAPSTTTGGRQQWFRLFTAILFWPLYLPALLQRPPGLTAENLAYGEPKFPGAAEVVHRDDLATAIHQVEAELDLALTSLGGWSDAVLSREQHRFDELRLAWHAQAAKIRELERVLDGLTRAGSEGDSGEETDDRLTTSRRARQANIARLRALRNQYRSDLTNTLAWVRELTTRIHLAKYTGAPASRAEELVMQIATSIEGMSEVASWQEADERPATSR